MMSWFARVQGGLVLELIQPFVDVNGVEVSVNDRFTPEFVSGLIDITGLDPKPESCWLYDGESFFSPAPYQLTPDELIVSNAAIRDVLLERAGLSIAPLQDAVDLEDAMPLEVALLKSWKQYRVAVNRVDLKQVEPVWPISP